MRLSAAVIGVVFVTLTLRASSREAPPATQSQETPGLKTSGQSTAARLDRDFAETVRPFVATYCVSCHGGANPAAQFDLRGYTDLASVVSDDRRWELVLERLAGHQMPPAQAKQPPAEARREVVAWINTMRIGEAKKHAGDPGIVLARRLSNAEYNYTIRDLTGVDIRPAREFPVDPANPAGFDNSGESLSMSPALLTKYLQAAREVSNHLVLRPRDLAFAPHPVLAETDRDRYAVERIVTFYRRQPTSYRDYFLAAWRFKHRKAAGRPAATLADFAAEARVSPKYLATVWRTLEGTKEDVGPLATLQAMWRASDGLGDRQLVDAMDRMRAYVEQVRKKIALTYKVPDLKGLGDDSQPMLMWRNRQYAAHRLSYDPSALKDAAATSDPDLQVPPLERANFEAAFARFSAVFPDAFYVSERGRYFPDNTRDTGRHLSAGFHNLMGYFRDDAPLYQLVLDEKGQHELDALWQDLEFVASATIRTYTQFYLSESGQARGDSAAPADRPRTVDVTSEPMILRVADNYRVRARESGNAIALTAVEEHFTSTNATIRWVERARAEAEPLHLRALQEFAARAYRRPLSALERDDLVEYYQSLRRQGLDHEEAMRDSIVSVLMSPDFCYRLDLVGADGVATQQPTTAAVPLSGYALASRLSYFLWSSMPDAGLLAKAATGDLRRPEVLASEARRMLKDPRVRGLAVEFGGNWLDFRRFEEHNAVDRERFEMFTNELRQAMFEEPVRFMLDVVQNNRSVLDFLYAADTVVNPVLARHYGMPAIDSGPDTWRKVDAAPYGRGGLLPMSVFLTKNAPGLRTSPVKRGYWVVKNVLGERIPPPPAVVPELPRDEAKLDLPLRALLARHREDPGCAGCHARFDALGLVFEGYGPVGERREQDLSGRPVDASATFPGGATGNGVDGLRTYVRQHRQDDFVANLSRKLMAYALNRSLMLSDEPAIDAMRAALASNGYRFDQLIEGIVTSSQFRTKRLQGATQ
jgi:mono/diheme cytochrome c family protein